MYSLIAMLLPAVSFLPCGMPSSPDDAAAIQGLWQAVALQANGKDAPAEEVKKFQIYFKKETAVFVPKHDNREHGYEIDPKTFPKSMDLIAGDGAKKGQKHPCAIYELEGDKLRICMDKEGKLGKRPTEFRTAEGDGLALLTLERVKEQK